MGYGQKFTPTEIEMDNFVARWDIIKSLDDALAVPSSWATSRYEWAIALMHLESADDRERLAKLASLDLTSAEDGECFADLAKPWANTQLGEG